MFLRGVARCLDNSHVINPKLNPVPNSPTYRAEIGKQTLQWCENGIYTTGKELFERSIYKDYPEPHSKGTSSTIQIEVKPLDCIDIAKEESAQQDNQILLILFASTDEFGGGFTDINNGQEESICRRSEMAGLMRYIGDNIQLQDPFQVNLHTMYLYTPNVQFFRSSEENQYQTFPPFKAGVLSSAALYCPQTTYSPEGKKVYSNQKEYEQMKKRIYHHIQFADEQGYSTLITGAFGCGAFQNPPEEVAALYEEAMYSSNLQHLKKVIFSILPDRNGSLETFQEHFSQ